MKKYLIFDFGASHGRCIVGIFHGDRIDFDVIHDFENVPTYYGDTLYWDILRMVSDMKNGLRMAFQKHPDIRSIGIDTWGCDFAFIDASGKLVGNPVNYRDELRYEYRAKLHQRYSEYTIYAEAGANTNNIMGMYHLYGLVQKKSPELEIAHKLLMIPDLLNYALTGIAANEYTDATMFLAVNPQTKQWSPRIMELCGFNPKWFGDLVMPGTVLGQVNGAVCSECGAGPVPVVAVASHDSASAVAGLPVSGADENWCYLSLGTWALLGHESEAFYNSEDALPTGFATQGGVDGRNNFVNLITGLWIIQQCSQKWRRDPENGFSWKKIDQVVVQQSRGRAYFSHDDPRFAQPSPDMPEQIREYCRETGQPAPKGMAEVAACVYENLVLILKEAYSNLRRFTGKEFQVLHVVGGGSNSEFLCQWIADALQITVKAGPAETTSVGNMLMQMKAMGDVSDVEEGRGIAARSFSPKIYLPDAAEARYWEQSFEKYRQICGKEALV